MSFLIKAEQLALTKKEKNRIADWHRHSDYKFSDKVFGKKDRITTPVTMEDNSGDILPDSIHDHLVKHNYINVDRVHHTAQDQYGREQSIGKALVRTKAPQEMIDKFSRLKKPKKHDLAITYSRHPIDVGAMSTSRGWKSCMNMRDHRRYWRRLEHDFRHGSHVAYIHQKEDTNIENPIGRVTLKPYVSHKGHKILRPEPRTYGEVPNAFHDHVQKWAEKHFPLKDGHFYSLPEKKIYTDDRHRLGYYGEDDPNALFGLFKNKNIPLRPRREMMKQYIINEPKEALKHMDDPDYKKLSPWFREYRKEAFIKTGHSKLNDTIPKLSDKEALETIKNNSDTLAEKTLTALGKKIAPKDLHKAAKHLKNYARVSALEGNQKLGIDYHRKMLDHPNDYVAERALIKGGKPLKAKALSKDNKVLNRQLIKMFPTDKNMLEHLAKSSHPDTLQELIRLGNHEFNDKFKDHPNAHIKNAIVGVGTPEQVSYMLKNHPNSIFLHEKERIAKEGNPEHLKDLLDYKGTHPNVRYEIATHNYLHTLDRLVNDPETYIRRQVAEHGHMHHLDQLVNDRSDSVKAQVAKHGHIHHLNQLVHDPSVKVKMEVANHDNMEHLDKLVNDASPDVRANVARHGHMRHLDKLVNDVDIMPRYIVATHRHKKHLDRLINSNIPSIKAIIAEQGHPDHIKKLASDPKNYLTLLKYAPEKYIKHIIHHAIAYHSPHELARIARPQVDHYLANSTNSDIRRSVAGNTTDQDILHKLADDSDPSVLHALVDRDSQYHTPELVSKIANNPNITKNEGNSLFDRHKNNPKHFEAMSKLIKDNKLSDYYMHSVLEHPEYYKSLLDKPWAYPGIIDKMDDNELDDAINSPTFKSRYAHQRITHEKKSDRIINNPKLLHSFLSNTEPETLEELARKHKWQEPMLNSNVHQAHLALAKQSFDRKLLSKLENHPDENIRHIAKTTLDQLGRH